MNANITALPASLVSEALRRLTEGLDTQKADDFLDQMFELAGRLGSVTCILADDSKLRVQARDTVLQEMEVARAKTKLRMLCARLAVRCGEWSGRKVFPYGDALELEHPGMKQIFKIHFVNTAAMQEVTIETSSANRLPKTT